MITEKWEDLIPLREKNSEEYVPSIQQIIDYAQFIGLEFPGDESLLYLAKQGITASLPEQWQACQTLSGEMVYRNLITKQIQAEHPLDLMFRKRVLQIKNRTLAEFYSEEFELTKHSQFLPAIQEDKAQFSESSLSDYFEPVGKGNQFKSNSEESLKNYKKGVSGQSGPKSFQTKRQEINRPKVNLKQESKAEVSSQSNGKSDKINQSKKIFKLNLKDKVSSAVNIEKSGQNKKNPQSLQIYASKKLQQKKTLNRSETVFNDRNLDLFNQTVMKKYIDTDFGENTDGGFKKILENREIQRLKTELEHVNMEKELKLNLLEQLKQANETKLALIKSKMQVKMNRKKKKENRQKEQKLDQVV